MNKETKIYEYMNNNSLDIEKITKDYSNYVHTIIKNSNIDFSNEDIEEIIVDVFFALWKNEKRLDINKSMSAYIAGITKNLIKNKIRNNSKKALENIDDFEDDIVDISNLELDVIKNEKEEIISNVLDNLKEEDKTVFIEYYYLQKSIKDLSDLLKMSEAKVKSKLFRVRKKLKKELKKRGYNYDG